MDSGVRSRCPSPSGADGWKNLENLGSWVSMYGGEQTGDFGQFSFI
jgi:hypothetical protein